jgi:allophanate hydrolase
VPAALHDLPGGDSNGVRPFGITLVAPGGHDGLLAAIGRAFHADAGLPMGALGRKLPALRD